MNRTQQKNFVYEQQRFQFSCCCCYLYYLYYLYIYTCLGGWKPACSAASRVNFITWIQNFITWIQELHYMDSETSLHEFKNFITWIQELHYMDSRTSLHGFKTTLQLLIYVIENDIVLLTKFGSEKQWHESVF